jgi:hypothetical protein
MLLNGAAQFEKTATQLKGEGSLRKLATATQPKFPRKITDFKQATVFQISRRKMRKFMFH